MIERKILGLFGFLMLTLVFACNKGPQFPDEPLITSVSLSTEIIDGVTEPDDEGKYSPDSLYLTIEFEDGNNDVGYPNAAPGEQEPSPPPSYVTLTDSRNGDIDTILVKGVNSRSGSNSVSGTITIRHTTCCVGGNNNGQICFPVDNLPETSSLTWDIKLVDRAGNWSNTVTSPTLTLDCYPE